MGYSTDYLGHIEVDPPLNEAEIHYLTAFSHSRRFDRGGDPYAVPGNPSAENVVELPTRDVNQVAIGQPGFACDWQPCWDGCCLAWSGIEKSNQMDSWLRYLVDHLIGPDAVGRSAAHPQLRGFTFDHVLNGLVIGCRRDNKELFALLVTDNQVERMVLHPGDPRYLDYPPLPYEASIDGWRQDRPRPRPRRSAIVELAGRGAPSAD